MCIADILKTASIHSVRQKDVYPGLQRGRHGACSVSESEVIQFLTSRKYNPFREVRYLPEPSSVLRAGAKCWDSQRKLPRGAGT